MAASGPRSPPDWAAPPRHAASNWPAPSIASSSSSRGAGSAMTEPSGFHSPQTQPGDGAGPNDPARCLWGLWRRGQRPNVEDFLAEADIRDPDRIVAVLRVDQWERGRLGQRVSAETYLDAFPAVRDQAEHAVELIVSEYLLREDFGEEPALEEYLDRFPQYAGALELQLELHQAIGADRQP